MTLVELIFQYARMDGGGNPGIDNNDSNDSNTNMIEERISSMDETKLETKGPFAATYCNPPESWWYEIKDPEGYNVATVYGGGKTAEEANKIAQLLAASWELLQACKTSADCLRDYTDFHVTSTLSTDEVVKVKDVLQTLKVAIEKAEGGLK